jgi:hypothetical protein
VSNELLTSQIDPGHVGVPQNFTLANDYVSGSVKLYISGLRKTMTTDFTEASADEITILVTPIISTSIICDYTVSV